MRKVVESFPYTPPPRKRYRVEVYWENLEYWHLAEETNSLRKARRDAKRLRKGNKADVQIVDTQ